MNSCAPVHPLTDPASVELALSNVSERSFFAFAEPAELSAASEMTAAAEPMITAGVQFRGPSSGELHVTMPVSLTRELAHAFAGDPDLEFSDADLVDMAGEFANMVTGSWLTAVDASSTFDLSMPVVTRIDTVPPATRMMRVNGQPVALTWRVE